MKFSRLIFAMAFAASVFTASAEDEGNYLHIRTATGWDVLSLNQVDRLTFTNGVMTATDKNNATVATFPQASLETMYVDETAGVGSPVVDEQTSATFTFAASTRTATMLADGEFTVYNAAGVRLVAIQALKGETITLTGLEAGVAILKCGDYSLKTVIK